MKEDTLHDGLITDEALEIFKGRVGTQLRIKNIFNELASKDSIRKFCDGIGDPNPLWHEEEYAQSTRFGSLIAPPSWLASVFPTWVLQGLPGVHAFQTSTDWEFFKPVRLDDRVIPECTFVDLRITSSEFAGKSILERQEARYLNQNGELMGRAKVAGLRAERTSARQKGKYGKLQLPHPWTEKELRAVEEEVLAEQIQGSVPRYWEEVQVGEELPQIVRGPLGLSDIIAYCIGASPVRIQAHGLALQEYRKHPAWAFRDSTTFALEPIYGVHYNKQAANSAGLPYPYDTAVQRHCWLMQLMTNWMSDEGWLKRSFAKYRNFVYLSDVLWIRGKVTRKYIDENDEHCIDIKTTATNQRGEEVMPGISTVILPSKKANTNPIKKRLGNLNE
jgi:acyl dehydratase